MFVFLTFYWLKSLKYVTLHFMFAFVALYTLHSNNYLFGQKRTS